MSVPSSPPPVPAVVGRFAAGRPVRAVWVNEEGGTTFRVGPALAGTEFVAGTEFIKVATAGAVDFAGAARRLQWAGRGRLGEAPPMDRLVVCHGDACAPNTLIDDDGHCSGHLDGGRLRVADRWADLAVATLSLGWNYPGRTRDADFFAAHGVEPDPARIGYHRRCGGPKMPPRAKLGG